MYEDPDLILTRSSEQRSSMGKMKGEHGARPPTYGTVLCDIVPEHMMEKCCVGLDFHVETQSTAHIRQLNRAKLTQYWVVSGLGYASDKCTTRSGPLSGICPEDTKPHRLILSSRIQPSP